MIRVYLVGNEYWTDLDVSASELWVVAGPRPYTRDDDETHGGLAEGFRWVTDDEWEASQPLTEVRG